MPSRDLYRRKLSVSTGSPFTTLGAIHRRNANIGLEATWDTDMQSRRCYIYDYYHDDDPAHNEGMTYDHTTKTPIDAKFIVVSYQSLSKDRVAYELQLRPSQQTRFEKGDDLYYYEELFATKYGAKFPVGMYIDIPDDNEVYHKWLIVEYEIGDKFPKYIILPCNYRYHWIEYQGGRRIKRKMWGVTRSQNSYKLCAS